MSLTKALKEAHAYSCQCHRDWQNPSIEDNKCIEVRDKILSALIKVGGYYAIGIDAAIPGADFSK